MHRRSADNELRLFKCPLEIMPPLTSANLKRERRVVARVWCDANLERVLKRDDMLYIYQVLHTDNGINASVIECTAMARHTGRLHY